MFFLCSRKCSNLLNCINICGYLVPDWERFHFPVLSDSTETSDSIRILRRKVDPIGSCELDKLIKAWQDPCRSTSKQLHSRSWTISVTLNSHLHLESICILEQTLCAALEFWLEDLACLSWQLQQFAQVSNTLSQHIFDETLTISSLFFTKASVS